MSRNLRNEPYIKKLMLMLSIGIILITVMNLLFDYAFIQKLYDNHINTSKQLVGNMVIKYPRSETEIVNAALRKNDKKAYEYGDKILKKYGFDEQVTAFKDKGFAKIINYIIGANMLILIFMFAIIIYIFAKSIMQLLKRLELISDNIDSVINGTYAVSIDNIEEGILSKINIQFYQMYRIVQMNFTKIRDEKENIKTLITDISHQLKTPLASIKMYNSILIEDEDITKDEKNEFLGISKKEISKLEWLIGSLVKLSRLEVGMIELIISNNPIRKTILDAVESIKAKAVGKNIDIITDMDEEYYIFHDYRWTKEAIVNVLENAVKYSFEKGKIKISIVPMNSYIRVDIEDNGIGIPKKDFNNVFKRFFRGDSEAVKSAEGSGVGLYLTRKILENQGGSITVDSVINKGAAFSLFFQRCN